MSTSDQLAFNLKQLNDHKPAVTAEFTDFWLFFLEVYFLLMNDERLVGREMMSAGWQLATNEPFETPQIAEHLKEAANRKWLTTSREGSYLLTEQGMELPRFLNRVKSNGKAAPKLVTPAPVPAETKQEKDALGSLQQVIDRIQELRAKQGQESDEVKELTRKVQRTKRQLANVQNLQNRLKRKIDDLEAKISSSPSLTVDEQAELQLLETTLKHTTELVGSA